MTFALQKRCSTTELSRHHLILPISASRVLEIERSFHHPKGQLKPSTTSCFGQGTTDMTFNGSKADDQSICNGAIRKALQ